MVGSGWRSPGRDPPVRARPVAGDPVLAREVERPRSPAERHRAALLHRVDKPASENSDRSIFVPELLVEAERLRVATADHRVQLHGPALS